MEAATKNDVDGIDADFSAACTTHHVYISDEWVTMLGKPSDLKLKCWMLQKIRV